jgi:hypothetical protein
VRPGAFMVPMHPANRGFADTLAEDEEKPL